MIPSSQPRYTTVFRWGGADIQLTSLELLSFSPRQQATILPDRQSLSTAAFVSRDLGFQHYLQASGFLARKRRLTRFIWSGTHRGEFLGIAATNRVVRVWGMVIDRFEDRKVKSTRIL